MKLSTKVIEIAGRNWLSAQLLLRGIQVATPEVDLGIDLIAFRENGRGISAQPLQLKCFTGQGFSLDRKYAGRGIPMVYIWNVLQEPCAYILDFEECLEALAHRRASNSWSKKGAYTVTRVGPKLTAVLAPYRNRWNWFEERLAIEQ